MKMPWTAAIDAFKSIVSELTVDDDLRAKLDFETDKLKLQLDKALLATKTTPKVDAIVKLLIATRDIIIPMFRPVGSLAMAAFAAYCDVNAIGLNEAVEVMLYGAPVGYGTSRHIDKRNETKRKMERDKLGLDDDIFD